MSLVLNRFRLALKNLRGPDWRHFERLCSAFLAVEFPSLRTTASPGGDRGRDAELFVSDNASHILFQFSVQEDWKAKIAHTFKRLETEFPNVTHVIFLSSQEIGAQGDEVRSKYIMHGKSLDIRDQNWFVDRALLDDSRRAAATEIVRATVDSFLQAEGVISNVPGLSGQEAKTALVYLEMQGLDENTSKSLTKSCYEALVKCALRGTNQSNRKSRQEIHKYISKLLPQHPEPQLYALIDSAIVRLSRSTIKHWMKDDEFHISFEEEEAVKENAAGLEILNIAFDDDVHDILKLDNKVPEAEYNRITKLIRAAIETYFFKVGEEFAQCLVGKQDVPLHDDTLRSTIIGVAPSGTPYSGANWVDFLEKITVNLLRTPSKSTTELLGLLSKSYTLFAFLSEVPDVQKATRKLFDKGVIWLDTTAVLPVIAERSLPSEMRPFTDLMSQLKRAGSILSITNGVLAEIEGHLNLCKSYIRSAEWKGRVPYVYSRFILGGNAALGFQSWLSEIMGDHRPLDDLADFLSADLSIEVAETPSYDRLPEDVVFAVKEYWRDVQDQRRPPNEGFNFNANRMAEHDAENYLSPLAQRSVQPRVSALGYSSWLLTLDSAAWKLMSKVDDGVRRKINHAPLISLDFLLNYLMFGPRRDMIDTSSNGPARIFISPVYEAVPAELMEAATQVRAQNIGVPERLIQRRIRDELDKQRMKAGDAQKAGLNGVDSPITNLFRQ